MTGQQSPPGSGTKDTAVPQPSGSNGCVSHLIKGEEGEDNDDSEVAAGIVP